MRRRITLAILATTAAALVLTGVGTYLVTRSQARTVAQTQLRDEARALLPFVTPDARLIVSGRQPTNPLRDAQLSRVIASLDLADAEVLAVTANGRIISGDLPTDLPPGTLRDAVRADGTASGIERRVVWATAASEADAQGRFVVVALSRPLPGRLSGGAGWVLVTGAGVLLLATFVALRLGDRIAAPLRATEAATRAIAAGDLSARVAEPGATQPEDELADLARSVNTMAAALERSRHTEQQFLLSVSHDLRTPLTSIRGYAEAIGDGAVTDAAHASRIILEEARRLERLVGDLLDLARLEAHQFSLHLERADLAALVTTAVHGFAPAADAAGVRLDVALTDQPVPVVVDPDRLAQVVANLCENALKYAASQVRVSVTVAAQHVVLSVDDDGPGIPAADLPHVFERLYTAQAAPRRASTGSGLGLAIARELVGAMGGTIAAATPQGQGTSMRVTLPLQRP